MNKSLFFAVLILVIFFGFAAILTAKPVLEFEFPGEKEQVTSPSAGAASSESESLLDYIDEYESPESESLLDYIDEYDVSYDEPEVQSEPGSSASGHTSGQSSGQTWREPVTGMEFVWVPAGCYQIGSSSGGSDEKHVHEVCLDGFWMAKHEVTNRQYRKYKSSHNSEDYKGVNLNSDEQPAVYVSWNDAKGFIRWLNSKTGNTFALPSEAQWEYAARAGSSTIRFWGDDPDDACRYANVHDQTSKSKFSIFTWPNHNCNDGYAATAPVGSFQPNNFGLYDMLGNVWEWCEDVYDKNGYSKHSRNNPLVLFGGSLRVYRGGGWGDGSRFVRCADRFGIRPSFTLFTLGFRLIRKN